MVEGATVGLQIFQVGTMLH